jgi:hypothetical protein
MKNISRENSTRTSYPGELLYRERRCAWLATTAPGLVKPGYGIANSSSTRSRERGTMRTRSASSRAFAALLLLQLGDSRAFLTAPRAATMSWASSVTPISARHYQPRLRSALRGAGGALDLSAQGGTGYPIDSDSNVLVVGATRGLGLEFVRQLLNKVLAGPEQRIRNDFSETSVSATQAGRKRDRNAYRP